MGGKGDCANSNWAVSIFFLRTYDGAAQFQRLILAGWHGGGLRFYGLSPSENALLLFPSVELDPWFPT